MVTCSGASLSVGGLAAEQLDQLIAQATTGGRWCDYLRQEPLERGGQQMRRTLKVPMRVVRATLDALVTASTVTASTPPVLRSVAAASSNRLRDRIRRGSMSSSSSRDG